MKIMVTVCDVCEGTPTKSYRLAQDGRKADVDLCEAHAQPFEAYLGQSAAPPTRARQRPTKKTSPAKQTAAQRKVYTIEEIEALKKK